MSNENVNNNNNFSLTSCLVFPAITTSASAISSIKRNKGVKNALTACQKEAFKGLDASLKPLHNDIFSRSTALAQNYEEYKGLSKKAAKYAKKAAKAQKGKVSLIDNFLNIFRKEKVTPDSIIKKASEADDKLKTATKTLKQGSEIIEATTKSGFKNTAKTLLKSEMKNPIVLAMTALELVPEFSGKVIPAFKNEGILAGLKQTGKSILKVGSNFISYAAGGVLGRIIGTSIGTLICPGVGSAVGGNIGDAIGSMLVGSTVTNVVDKALNEDETLEENQITTKTPQQEQEIPQQELTQIAQENNPIEQTNTNELTQAQIASIPSFKEAKAKYATKVNSIPQKTTKGYQKPQNGVYATQWVNEMAQAKRQNQLNTLS